MEDNELLRVLARASGYKITPVSMGLEISVGGVSYESMCNDYEEAWAWIAHYAPDWRHSVDAALNSLPWPPNHQKVMHQRVKDGKQVFSASMNVFGGEYPQAWGSPADMPTLARALCEVFAAWAVAQEEEGEK